MKITDAIKLTDKAKTKNDGIYSAFGYKYLVIDHCVYAFTERVLSGQGETFKITVELNRFYGGFNVVLNTKVIPSLYLSDQVGIQMLKDVWNSIKKGLV